MSQIVQSTSKPLVSVVIPAYNQAAFLGEAIQSVLNQTYSNFEIIVVDDDSPDQTAEVVKSFTDNRIKYIRHEINRGLPATRNTGMRASSGEYIALLDADDFFHPQKLELHLDYLKEHPEIGVSFNSRFELNYSSDTIRDIYRVNDRPTLKDFVLGFPFSPSDMVIRRVWAFKINLFDEKCIYGAEDLDFPCRLSLNGCQFGRVDRALSYRRHHSTRAKKNLLARRDDWIYALDKVFTDPRCQENIRNLRNHAYTEHYLVLIYLAIVQGELEIGQEFLREAVRLTPEVIEGCPSKLIDFMIKSSVADDKLDPEIQLKRVFSQFPPEYGYLRRKYDWAVGRGYLIKAVRAIIWGREKEGREYTNYAKQWGGQLDDSLVSYLLNQLVAFQIEYGYEQTRAVIDLLANNLSKIEKGFKARQLIGPMSRLLAFDKFRNLDYSDVPEQVFRAFVNEPNSVTNRGLWSILLRSLMQLV